MENDVKKVVSTPVGDVVRHDHYEMDKISVFASVKLGLRNYSNVSVDLGMTKSVKPDDDKGAIADELFNEHILNRIQKYVGTLATGVSKMIDIVEKKGL